MKITERAAAQKQKQNHDDHRWLLKHHFSTFPNDYLFYCTCFVSEWVQKERDKKSVTKRQSVFAFLTNASMLREVALLYSS